MEKLLITGINTRGVVNSGLKLNYSIYSTSYFYDFDFKKNLHEKHVLNQEKDKSCGFLEENYTIEKLLNLSLDYLEEVDYIIPLSGISPSDFRDKFKGFKNKILGNKDISHLENKFDFYKKIKNKYKTPETFKLKNVDEISEILKNNNDKHYLLKPLKGYGGSYINFLNNELLNQLNDIDDEWIIQEYIEGKNLSSSVLATKNNSKTIINSINLNENNFKKKNNFLYSGNILPVDKKLLRMNSNNIINDLNNISEDIISEFNLIGSNGVDYILDEKDELNVLEINPRIQGTFECCESLLKINMLEAHIKSCNNELININSKNNEYCMKKIIYSKDKVKINNLNVKNLYDIPYPNVIIEKNQPIATIINKNNSLKKLCESIKKSSLEIKKNLMHVK